MPKICLNMIVKNEKLVIDRCLASVKPWIDSWCIVDTGSDDDTPARCNFALIDLPGRVFSRPWKNFGHNRSEAIALADEYPADYLLFLDADEVLVCPEGWTWPDLHADAYLVLHRYGGMEYYRAALASTRLPWRYEGVLHEYLTCDQPHRLEKLEGPYVLVRAEGSRSKNPQKFQEDATLLEGELAKNPGNPRTVFYLAQSYRDMGNPLKAITAYIQRAMLGGWDEEVWYSWYQVGLMREGLGMDPKEVLQAYLNAYNTRPSRPETQGQLARWFRGQNQHHLAHLFAKQSQGQPPCQDVLFVDPSWAAWHCADEYALSCFYTGRFGESYEVWKGLLNGGTVPDAEQGRIQANLGFAEAKLGSAKPADPEPTT